MQPVSPTQALQVVYAEPRLSELLALCQQFDLVYGYERTDDVVQIQCRHEDYTLSPFEAEMLLRGLLLGFFHRRSKDDLSLARWA